MSRLARRPGLPSIALALVLLCSPAPARADGREMVGGPLTPVAAVEQALFFLAFAIVVAVGALAVLSGRKPVPPSRDLDPHGHGTGWGDGPALPRRGGPGVR